MKYLSYLFCLLLILTQLACVTDPLDEIEEGNWNNERNIINIKLANQVGQAEIERIDDSNGEIILAINVDAIPDLSSIEILQMQLSYGAMASVQPGEALNFENDSHSASLTVTSPTGKSREYQITATSFTETILGTYDVTGLTVYGGTGPEYGGGAILAMTDKPWIWPETNGPEAELDNEFVFELTGITDDGNTYGTFMNNAGEDGLYADFQYVADPPTDINNFYRKVPAGQGEWSRNYTTGLITFTFSDGHTTSGTFVTGGSEDVGYDHVKTFENQALAFDLNGTDDWDKIYSDYDKFVKRPRRYWIDMSKKE